MKYVKNAKHNYEMNGISEENSWIKWYSKETIGRRLRLSGIYAQGFLIASALVSARVFSEDIKTLGILKLMGLLAVNIIILLFIVAPMREFFHLLPISNGKLDDNCIISFRNHFSVYNGKVTRTRILFSLALPLIVFVAIFATVAILTSGIMRFLAILLLVESSYMCYTDIYMFFFCFRNIKKNEIVFGEYKKSK